MKSIKACLLYTKIIAAEDTFDLDQLPIDEKIGNHNILSVITRLMDEIKAMEIESSQKQHALEALEECFAGASIFRVPDNDRIADCFCALLMKLNGTGPAELSNRLMYCYVRELCLPLERMNIKHDEYFDTLDYSLREHLQCSGIFSFPATYSPALSGSTVSVHFKDHTRTKDIVDHLVSILPPALQSRHIDLYTTTKKRSFYSPLTVPLTGRKKGIFLNKDALNCEYTILHEYLHQVDHECLLPETTITKLIKLTHLVRNTPSTGKLILEATGFVSSILFGTIAGSFHLLSTMTLSYTVFPAIVLLFIKFTYDLCQRPEYPEEGKPQITSGMQLPTDYSRSNREEMIAELVTTVILYGDAYRAQPRDSLFYQLYTIVTEEILEGCTYTRDENMLVVQGPRTTDKPFRPRHEPSRWERLRRILD